jgi:hypothetical protein
MNGSFAHQVLATCDRSNKKALTSAVGLGCVKTCTREEAAELFSSLASPDGVHQRVYFSS